jgi:hypothetical protein
LTPPRRVFSVYAKHARAAARDPAAGRPAMTNGCGDHGERRDRAADKRSKPNRKKAELTPADAARALQKRRPKAPGPKAGG